MQMPEVFWHQHRHRLSNKFGAGIAKNSLGGAIDEEDRALFVNGDDGIRSSVSNDPRDLIEIIRCVWRIVPRGLSHVMIETNPILNRESIPCNRRRVSEARPSGRASLVIPLSCREMPSLPVGLLTQGSRDKSGAGE